MASLVELLAAVDDLPASECGALVVDGDVEGPARGTILVETGRICWAHVPGRRTRLRDLLHQHATREVEDRELDDALARCRAEQRPLGELLVERALVSVDGLRAALKQHTIESLIAQCERAQGSDPPTWIPRRHRGYQPRFTFPPIELLAAVGAELYPGAAEGAAPDLQNVLPVSRSVASFTIDDDGFPVPVFVGGAIMPSIRDLLELGDWATAALSACNGFSSAVMARAVADATGPMALGWRLAPRLIHVAVIGDPGALATAVAMLALRGVPAVLSSRVLAATTSFERSNSHPTL